MFTLQRKSFLELHSIDNVKDPIAISLDHIVYFESSRKGYTDIGLSVGRSIEVIEPYETIKKAIQEPPNAL